MANIRFVGFVLLTLIFACQTSVGQSDFLNYQFELGNETFVNQSALRYVPDGGISFINKKGSFTAYIPASRETYRFKGTSLDNLPAISDCVFGPTYAGGPNCRTNSGNSGFDKDYAAPGSVLEIPNSTDLLMIYHGEDQTCGASKTTVGIGMARSSNDGLTWRKLGQIIGGQDISKKCQRFIGAGVPNAIFMPDGYLYVYYVDWSGQDIDEIHVARVASTNLDSPSDWRKFNVANGWTERGLNGSSTAVIHRAEPGDQTVYASLPQVSYNTKLHRYLALWGSRSGFYTAISTDGLNWVDARQIWTFPEGSADECGHGNAIWYGYASLLSPDEASQQVSNDSGYLYYARGECNPNQPHQMVRRTFRISIP